MLKRIVIVLSLLAMLLTLPIVANAEEWGEIDGLSHSYRWYDVRTSSAGKKYCYLLISDDYVLNNTVKHDVASLIVDNYNNPDYSNTHAHGAIQDWNDNSEGKVLFVDSSSLNSNVDILFPTSLNFTMDLGDYARTFLRNSSNQWSASDGPYSPGGFTHGNATYGSIIFNPSIPTSVTAPEIAFVIKHEMGHVLGLGHTNTYNSIMREGFTATVVNIKPYDIDVLDEFYPN